MLMTRLDSSFSRLSFQPRQSLLAAAALAFFLVGCGKGQAPAPAAPPPPEVGVVTVTLGDVGLVTELPGRLEASRVAQVRARAAGILQKRLFREGSDVKVGQPLYTIDSAPYAAAVASARASQARAEANLAQASALVERYKPLVEANAISKQDYANAVAAQKQAAADVAVGKANVQTASITLGYASVTAPISGRIGRSLVTEGALVGQGDATQLAVIQRAQAARRDAKRPVQTRQRRQCRQRTHRARRRYRIRAARSPAVHRPNRGRRDWPDHAARRSA